MSQKSNDLFRCLCCGSFFVLAERSERIASLLLFAHLKTYERQKSFFNSHETCVANKRAARREKKSETFAFVDVASDVFPLPSFVRFDFFNFIHASEFN